MSKSNGKQVNNDNAKDAAVAPADVANEQNSTIEEHFESLEAQVAVDSAIQTERVADDVALSQIQELLFGAMLDEVRAEMKAQARTVLGTVKSLHREFSQSTSDLQQQIDDLRAASLEEAHQREDQCEALTDLLNETGEAVTKRLLDQEHELECAVSRVDADLKTQHRNQQRSMEQLESKLNSALESNTEELRTGKLNRAEFASLLATLAGKVSGDEAANEQPEQALASVG